MKTLQRIQTRPLRTYKWRIPNGVQFTLINLLSTLTRVHVDEPLVLPSPHTHITMDGQCVL